MSAKGNVYKQIHDGKKRQGTSPREADWRVMKKLLKTNCFIVK